MNVCYKPTLKLDWYHLWRIRCCFIARSILLFRLKLHPSRLKIMYSTEKTRVLMMPPLSSLVASEMMIKCSSLCRQWLQSQPHDNYWVSVHIDGLSTRVDRMGGRADSTDHNTIAFSQGKCCHAKKVTAQLWRRVRTKNMETLALP